MAMRYQTGEDGSRLAGVRPCRSFSSRLRLAAALLAATAALATPARAQSRGGARPTPPQTQPTTKPAATTQPTTRPASAPATQPVPLATQPATAMTTVSPADAIKIIEAQIAKVSADTAMDASLREKVLDAYKQAKAQLDLAQTTAARTAALAESADGAPVKTAALRQATTQPTSQPATAPAESMALPEIEAQLKKMELELGEWKKKSDAAGQTLSDLTKRLPELPADISKARDELSNLHKQADAIKASADPDALKNARLELNAASVRAMESRVQLLEKTLTTSDALANLTRAQQEYFSGQVSRMQTRITAWQDVVSKRREAEAKRQVQQAKQEVKEAAGEPVIQAVWEYNTELAQYRTGPDGLNARRQQANGQQGLITRRLNKLNKAFDEARNMVNKVGATDVIGIFLRSEREKLPDIREHRVQSQKRQQELARVGLKVFELQEKLSEVKDVSTIEAHADQLIAEARPPIPENRKEDVHAKLVKAMLVEQDKLNSLIGDLMSYSADLTTLDTEENILITKAEQFRAFIDKTVLWTRSAQPMSPGDVISAGKQLGWFVSPTSWRSVTAAMADSIRRAPVLASLAALAVVVLLLVRARLVSRVRLLGKRANQYGRGAMPRMLEAVALTLLAACAWPGVMLLAGVSLIYGGEQGPFAHAVGNGLMVAATGWLPLAVVIGICRNEGLGETFFRWPTDALRRKVRSLRWLVAVELPLLVIAASMQYQADKAHREILGRVACIVLLIVLGFYIAWMFWPGGKLVLEGLGRRRTGWLYRFRILWYALAVFVPLWLAGAAVMGYYYTTLQLSGRLMAQLWVIIALVVLQAMLRRWFTIGAARLARARQSEPPTESAGADASMPLAAKEPSLPTVSEATAQVRQFADYFIALLTLVSFWLVWADVMPALGVLSDVQLWTVGSGAEAIKVSLADLFVAVVAVVLTVIASKNIPGILEVAVLRRLRIESGVSYAINALARYVIVLVGIVLTAQAIGISWGQVQWLIAAVSVGLGFGLQEIFGNFISGLILLFERPIRVGDVVTVGDVSGTVTQIRIRATTILDWDRKELVVPNKEFITGRLVNWTLSDTVLRVVIKVGVAYGSDTRKARELLLKVANQNARTLKNPQPTAYFLGFGDSTLNFDLRVYIGSIADYLDVQNELHMAIDDAFRKADIKIAFPQRDIHIRSIKAPLAMRPMEEDPR